MKKVNLACLFMLWQIIAYAQTDTTGLLGAIQSTFSALNPSNIPTGILINRTLPMGNILYFTGNGDSVCEISNYRQIILDLHNAAKQNTTIIPSIFVTDQKASTYLDDGIFPIGITFVKYDYIKAEAVDSGWIAYDTTTQKLYDIQNPAVWPYADSKVFAAGIFNPVAWKGICKFKLPTDLYISNINLSITNVQVNFSDGNGYVNWAFDETKTINYTNFEEGTELEILVKVTYSNSEIYIAKTKFVLSKTGDDITPDITIEVKQNFRTTYNTCNITNGFTAADARIYIQYANRLTGQLIKPIIFVEGFDVDNNPNDNRYGDINWETYKTGICRDEDGKQKAFQLQNLPVFLDRLKQEGYDLIIVDFKSGGTRIESNALTLTSIIQWANSTKVGKNELAVMGASMGGLVVRYALKLMEQQNCKHCTRLYSTFDSPHQGANIPLAIQHFTKFFSQVDNKAKDSYDKKLSAESALQMLVYHANSNASNFRPQWQSTINTMGHPDKPLRVALINGASNGSGLGFTAGAPVIQYNSSILFAQVIGNSWSAPNSPNQASGQLLFEGKAPKNRGWTVALNFLINPVLTNLFGMHINHYNESMYYNFPTLPYDNAPGGKTETFKDIKESDLGMIKKKYPSIPSGEDHCFIPSTSALDINTNNLFMDIFNNLATGTVSTPFSSIYYPDRNGGATNEKHVEVTTGANGNIEWIINELKQNEPNAGVATLPNSNGNTFNYASASKKLIKGNIEINNNGQLRFYGNFQANYATATDVVPAPNETQTYITSDCDVANIRIHSGGKFIIGDNNNLPNNNKALVYITTGSTVTIRNGGELKIHANSKLIIQKGAQLIIENGAIVNLIDANGALVIEGELKMEQNAIFSTIGNGYVHFKKTTNSSPIITSVGNNTIHIKGNGSSASIASEPLNLLIEGGILSIPSTLNLFKIENSKCEFVNQSGLNIFSQGVEIINSNFNKTAASTQKHKGIQVNGNSLGQNFSQVRIDNAETAISSHMEISVSSELNLNNVRFYDCGLGLETVGGSFNWINGGAERCSTLVVAQASDGFNYIDNIVAYRGTITAFGTGINFTGGTNTYLQIQKSTITGYDYNLRAYNVWLDLKCNTFLNSIIDEVYIENALLSSSVPMGTGYNIFKGQNWSLFTDNATVYLNEGYSSYNSSVLSIPRYGVSTLSCAQPLTGNDVLANYNEWKFSPNYYGFELTCNSNYSGVMDNNAINTTNQSYINARDAHCGFNTVGGGGLGKTNSNSGNVVGEYLTSNTDTSIILNTTKFINKTFAEAFQLTVTKFNSKDSLKNYFDIVNEFKEIVTSNNQYLTRNERIVKSNSYIKILHCLALMVTKKKIAVAANIAINSNISDVINLQNILLSRTEIDSTWMNWKFRINFDKALLFKMAEKNDIALQKLDSILFWNLDSNYTKLVNEWKCYINGETALANKTVTTDSLKYYYPCYIHKPKPNLYLALQKSSLNSFELDKSIDKKSLLKVYPNPTKEFIILETIDKTQKPNNIQIFDLLGKLLLDKMNTQMEGLNYKINVSNLPNGVYIIKATFEKEEFIRKFIKE